MAVPKRILNFLDKNKIKYEIIQHRIVYTAIDKAATLHLDAKQVIKTVAIKCDNKDYALVLIPANKNLDKNKLKIIINKWRKKQGLKAIKKLDFAKESWMKKTIKGCKVGATPPFGMLYHLPTFIDQGLLRQPKLIINAGDYKTSLKLNRSAFEKIMKIGEVIKGSFSKSRKKK